jgi:hypothetical protein
MVCQQCGSYMHRVQRRGWSERIRYQATFCCTRCEAEARRPQSWMLFVVPQACCPLCGSQRLTPLESRDRIDRMYRNPLSYLQRFLGAPLYHCFGCRLQFYDLRPLPHSVVASPVSTAPLSTVSLPRLRRSSTAPQPAAIPSVVQSGEKGNPAGAVSARGAAAGKASPSPAQPVSVAEKAVAPQGIGAGEAGAT